MTKLADGRYSGMVVPEPLQKELEWIITRDKFAEHLRKFCAPSCTINDTTHSREDIASFEIKFVPTLAIESAIINVTDEFIEFVKILGEKYFKSRPQFNNNRTIFWFFRKYYDTKA
jgi:hypothetical protein